MKHLIVTIIAVLLAGSTFAQPAAGTLFFGGSMSYYQAQNKVKQGSTSQDGITQKTLTLLPAAGYYLNDRMAAGISLGITSDTSEDPDPSAGDPAKINQTVYSVSPFFRYYLLNGTGGIYAEASARGGFGNAKFEFASGDLEYNINTLLIGIAPGVYYFITGNLAVEAQFGWIGFESEKYSDSDLEDTTTILGVDLSPASLSFGLTINL